ncbi:lysylphosphatidylglycerol synthase transmembrane domain-containing protein [Phycisphaera mikurensis]|uniref:Flippase-like domain-containing protein n=1 Tax=Phycisphaera mikurensis (strain NBRC 102666 / KCTC 22515 / FYK2301M01) TaxID=1142394 RepID=I0ID32_PHYMF|nr:lysylphosphatidylglycerol synthase transmembrane domain-containing protein [Phycisphaera mikurensis]MBB6442295.1 uncharacterized membrane protein YbhN (UPF0104 family) [Phycisphaera mikurensis]BAM03170.1 hypothetical protein PSMK_10110 [Phycisphaera mikurensis NBRC 102666]
MPPAAPPKPLARRILGHALRLGVAAAGIAYIVKTVRWTGGVAADGSPEPGFLDLLRDADPGLLLLGLALAALSIPVSSYRWWGLLRAAAVPMPFLRTLRLTYVGNFFNYCIPVGSTGGDVVKAYYAGRGHDRGTGGKTAVWLSVFVDRCSGLFGLLVLATLVGVTQLGDETIRPVVLTVGVVVLAGALAIAGYGWGPTFRGLRLARLDRLRGVGGVFRAARVYREQGMRPVVRAIALTLAVHGLLTVSAACAGLALGLGEHVSLGRLLVVLPLCIAAAAVPLTYQGLGVMEALAISTLAAGDSADNGIVGMLLFLRGYQLTSGFVGAVLLLAFPMEKPGS